MTNEPTVPVLQGGELVERLKLHASKSGEVYVFDDDIFAEAASRIAELEGENARLKPIPSEFEEMFGVCYRSGPPTELDYDEAIEALKNAREAYVFGDSMGCRVCEDSGHGANQCHHNPLLLARKWASASRFWQCWHCGFVATNAAEGDEHFGKHDGDVPSCERAELEARAQSAEAALVVAEMALEPFATKFVVKKGPNSATSQYGELELWWAARDVEAEPDATGNPWMCMAVAGNSFSLVCMSELDHALRRAAQALQPNGEENG